MVLNSVLSLMLKGRSHCHCFALFSSSWTISTSSFMMADFIDHWTKRRSICWKLYVLEALYIGPLQYVFAHNIEHTSNKKWQKWGHEIRIWNVDLVEMYIEHAMHIHGLFKSGMDICTLVVDWSTSFEKYGYHRFKWCSCSTLLTKCT
jgi:hypothetical protein